LSTDEDRRIAAAGLKLTRKIVLESETFKKFSPEEYRPGIHLTEDEDILKAAADYAQTFFILLEHVKWVKMIWPLLMIS